ncbi:GCN5-related N-acetyltransferase [Spironucleus salmonicida]|uniref:GCN5-related N-acetyltransferase n=1 Tax=Spironucleus salmonicida TaxID=348837 RepID=V6LN41_9EUKA|nr:GCN5-related N-acetyltransferase [Spironucleus salmonicida]|eukprot:EST46112.1 GCN5-related N-acetyltransferase [Spironucleus salmonicida]
MMKQFSAINDKQLFQQIILLRMVAFDNYEHDETELRLDNEAQQFALIENTEVVASFRLLKTAEGQIIQKLCADKSGRFKGAGARLVEMYKAEAGKQIIYTNCYVKLAGFWSKLGFEPTGKINGEKQEYLLK